MMKLNYTTLSRILRTQSQMMRLPDENLEYRYTWKNVIRANLETNKIPLTGYFHTMHLFKNCEFLKKYESSDDPYEYKLNLNRIIRKGNPSLEKHTPENRKQYGCLGYENSSPYGEDHKYDKRKIDVTNTLDAASGIDQKAQIAFLMAETTRTLRFTIDRRSTLGYYSSSPPHISDSLVDSILEYFDETGQLEKEVRFAERMKRYDVATKTALKMGDNLVASDCLYLDGKTDQALELYIENAKYPMSTYYWLFYNSEVELAKRTAPLIIERLEKMRLSKSSVFDSTQRDIDILKDILN